MCVLCDFYRFFNALGAPKTHKKKTGTDENRPLYRECHFFLQPLYHWHSKKKCCRPENWVSRTWNMQKLFGTVAFQAVSGRKLKREGTENSRSIYSASDNWQPKTVIHKDKQATQTYHYTSIHSPISRVRYKELRGRRSRRSRGTCTSVKPWGKWGMIWKIDWTSWMDDLFRLIVWPDTSPFPSLSEKTLIQVKVPQVGTVLSPLAEILELELSKTSWSCERTWQCRNALTFFEAYLELPWPLHLGLKALKSDMWVLKSHYYIEFWMSSKNHEKHFKKKIVSI